MKRKSTMIRSPRILCSIAVVVALPVAAVPVYNGGSGGVAFGVTSYGPPTPGVPTYIPNNINGISDVLTSPGGTFLTANPVIANNIVSSPYVGLPMFLNWVGGGNINGPFGSGSATILGPVVGYGISDPVAGSGSASYGIAHWEATFTDAAGSPGFGSWLSIAGNLPAVGSAGVVALRSHITSVNNTFGSPFIGGYDMPELVLALSRNGPLLYSYVALGGPLGLNAAMLVDAPTGNFRGLAINNIAAAIPAGEIFKVESTLTFYADPAYFDAYFNPDQALIDATGTTLPTDALVSTVPEPGSAVLLGLGVLAVISPLRRRR
jgi:hypothetical protein